MGRIAGVELQSGYQRGEPAAMSRSGGRAPRPGQSPESDSVAIAGREPLDHRGRVTVERSKRRITRREEVWERCERGCCGGLLRDAAR